MTVPGCVRGMLQPTFARGPFRRIAAVVPFPRAFGGAELAITSDSTPQSSCIQSVGIVQLFCMHVGAVHLDHLWCGHIRT